MTSTAASADGSLVCFDLETTGLSSRTDRIIEIGAVKFDGTGVLDTYSTLADPDMPLPLVIQRLCGLHDPDLRGQPTPTEAVAGLALFCEGCTLVGHGVSFDMAFCAEILPREFSGRLALDTAELARVLLPSAPSHSLEELSRSLDLPHDRPHRALSDAQATQMLFLSLIETARALPPRLREQVRQLCAQGGWPTGEYLAQQLAVGGPPAPDGAVVQPPAPVPSPPVTESSGDAPGGIDEAGMLAAFGPEGGLAHVEPEFELREEQQQMALAVSQAFNRSQTLLVEAGTGVGKSLAYLMPAREWAARGGGRVVVSTHTITLQEQLAQHDVPLAELAQPLPLRTAVLKGRGNYLSLRRLERWLAAGPAGRRRDPDEVRFKVRALIWAHQSEVGDRAELRLAGRDPEFWEKVGSTVDDCLGPACHNWRDGRCFMVKARVEARDAHVVIVNHALLLSGADSGGAVLPEFHHLIIDEAHHLEEAATQAQGVRLGLSAILAVTDRIPDFGDVAVNRALKAARQTASAAFADLRQLVAAESGSAGRRGPSFVVLDRRLTGREAWERTGRSVARLGQALRQASSALHTAADLGNVQPSLWPQPDNGARECSVAAEALQGMARVVTSALANLEGEQSPESEPAAGDQVAWVEVERGDRAVLRTAPAEVASSLREHLFERCETVVLTSATMAVAGSFRYIRDRLGLEAPAELVLDSPFDYLRQSLCCLPRGMPGHGDPQHPRVVAELVAQLAVELGGRTLVLFTGYQALREVHGQLRNLLQGEGIAVLGQGLDGTRNQVLRNFRKEPRTVLLGTNSFWEGIDLPGDTLQCVVIDKLPFPVPTDPIFQARARGRADSFAQLSLPEAVLRLKQGFGRLVRRHGDRGAVVICDPRILERRYGEEFVRALPKAAFLYEPPDALAPLVGAFLRGEMPTAVVG
ncbi:MAG TPA: helicase C-terminal domain-containing protein [Candidatus Acidoferrales bacterium]|nr:helicase C-terminal domain-containing protein [Candidatus Acidoferrales bacterium]